ncbi:hypothetical protein, variant [Phialophora macrospora]|uniref:Uncharacterized protein n=1 Tax=Phialophora macrospora TaxID=1851006 RepID=A0A0D2FX62_9EURO|nr:hypothetical protein PV04_01190 [Phialophora macrospora]KIW73039.1 hypothetical protein, variant [Phialophora macrospora]
MAATVCVVWNAFIFHSPWQVLVGKGQVKSVSTSGQLMDVRLALPNLQPLHERHIQHRLNGSCPHQVYRLRNRMLFNVLFPFAFATGFPVPIQCNLNLRGTSFLLSTLHMH